jgi:hypothetical protein
MLASSIYVFVLVNLTIYALYVNPEPGVMLTDSLTTLLLNRAENFNGGSGMQQEEILFLCRE